MRADAARNHPLNMPTNTPQETLAYFARLSARAKPASWPPAHVAIDPLSRARAQLAQARENRINLRSNVAEATVISDWIQRAPARRSCSVHGRLHAYLMAAIVTYPQH
jgi:hypothetical protein